MKYQYIVITHVCDGDYGDDTLVRKPRTSNWYLAGETPTTYPPMDRCKLESIKLLAFHPGELLICDNDGRELAYPQRRPDKWLCRYRTFSSLEKAISLAVSITEEDVYTTREVYNKRRYPEPKTDKEWDAWVKLAEE